MSKITLVSVGGLKFNKATLADAAEMMRGASAACKAFGEAAERIGRAAGEADAANDAALLALLDRVNGKTDRESVDLFTSARNGWQTGYAEAHGVTENGASQQWNRTIRRLLETGAFVRPQTPEQKRGADKKAKQREADKAEKTRQIKAGKDAILRLEKLTKQAQAAEAVAAPVVGVEAGKAARVMLELDPMEAHLIQILRAGKAAEAAKLVGELSAKPTAKAK